MPCRNFLRELHRDGTCCQVSHSSLLQFQVWIRRAGHLLLEERTWEGMPTRPMLLPATRLRLCWVENGVPRSFNYTSEVYIVNLPYIWRGECISLLRAELVCSVLLLKTDNFSCSTWKQRHLAMPSLLSVSNLRLQNPHSHVICITTALCPAIIKVLLAR